MSLFVLIYRVCLSSLCRHPVRTRRVTSMDNEMNNLRLRSEGAVVESSSWPSSFDLASSPKELLSRRGLTSTHIFHQKISTSNGVPSWTGYSRLRISQTDVAETPDTRKRMVQKRIPSDKFLIRACSTLFHKDETVSKEHSCV